MWIEFPSLLPISTFLLFLSPSEHSTQYSAEIIFCWMRFGHKSRADLLRPLHSLFPGLLSTWQFKSLITLTRNPFRAAQSGPVGWAPPGTRAALRMVWAHGQDTFTRTQGAQRFHRWSRYSPPYSFLPASASEGHLIVTSAAPVIHIFLREQENATAFCHQIAILFSGFAGCSVKDCCCFCLVLVSF